LGSRGYHKRITSDRIMMKAYTIVKQEIEALFGVQGVILRIYEGEVQYIVAFADFKKIGQLREIIPVADWRMDFLGKQGVICISYPADMEQIRKEMEERMFP
jgi:hypothetical protein